MMMKTAILCAFALGLAVAAVAMPTAQITPGMVSMSVTTQSINRGADATSRIYEVGYGIKPALGLTMEVAKIGDIFGTSHLTSVYFRKEVLPGKKPRETDIRVAGYAGLTRLAVDEDFGDRSNRTGIAFGGIADYAARPELTFYGRAGVAFLEEELWTLDAGLSYEVRPNWFVTMGYRSYHIDGSSMGGPLVGATYHVTK